MNREDRLNLIIAMLISSGRVYTEDSAVEQAKLIESLVKGIIRRENQTEHLGENNAT
jgi:hypothetical protein